MQSTEADRSGLLALSMLARFHHVAASPDSLAHHFARQGEPTAERDILLAAKHLKLKAKAVTANGESLADIALPAIAETKDGGYLVIARVSDDKVLYQTPGSQSPSVVSREAFEALWTGRLILITRRAFLEEMSRKFDIRWFIPALAKYKRLFAEVLVASFFIQLFALISPLFFQVVIDKVLVHQGLTTLDVLAIGLIVVSLFEIVLGGLRTYLFSHTTNRVDVELGAKLFRHLLALPISYFQSRQVGQSVARVRELENIRNFITGSALTVVIDLLFTVVFLAVMYLYSPILFAIVVGAIPLYIILSVIVTPILRNRLNEKFARGAENQAFLVESVNGVETLKAMAVEPQMQRRWEEQLAGYVGASFKAANLGNISSQIAGFINKLTVVLILWIGARLVIQGELSVGQLVAFNMLAGRVSGPVLRLVQLWQDFQQAGISIERLGDILNTPTEPTHNPNRTTLPDIEGRVSFDQVTFRYRPDGKEVLRSLSLDIQPGEVIGVVGRSGSGKSTLTKLIQRLYTPEAGRVMIDGVDIRMVDTAWLRRQIGVVLQENLLFNRSVRDNIALADPGMPMERIVAVAKLAGAHDFILELTEGYDTLVGEHGANLSGGQRQRIAIARALLTNPRILIFDEATSALDYESERLIQDNMRAISKDRTVIIVAHRLTTVRDANRIIVVDNGQIVEAGDHNSLMQNGGYYARLYSYQNARAQVRVVPKQDAEGELAGQGENS